jgi:hypothetical protein
VCRLLITLRSLATEIRATSSRFRSLSSWMLRGDGGWKTRVLINRMTSSFRPKKVFEHANIALWIHCNCTPIAVLKEIRSLQFQMIRWHTRLSLWQCGAASHGIFEGFHLTNSGSFAYWRPHNNWMVNQRLQDGAISVLPTTQQLTIFSVAKLPDSLLHPIYDINL